jgi:hypothetical protein
LKQAADQEKQRHDNRQRLSTDDRLQIGQIDEDGRPRSPRGIGQALGSEVQLGRGAPFSSRKGSNLNAPDQNPLVSPGAHLLTEQTPQPA